MTDCPNGMIRDLLPGHVHGTLGATDDALVAEHLASCAECRSEVALIQRLVAGLSSGVPRVDVAAVVAALPPRRVAGRTAAAHSLSGARSWQYAAAAALVLAVGGGLLWQRSPGPVVERVADSLGVADSPVELTRARSTAPVRSEEGIIFGGGLSDLSLNDLQALLGQMDSVRTLPSTDPESMTPVIALKEGGKTL